MTDKTLRRIDVTVLAVKLLKRDGLFDLSSNLKRERMHALYESI
jgi:hypothetical protein